MSPHYVPDLPGKTLGEEMLFHHAYASEGSMFPFGLFLFLLALILGCLAHCIYGRSSA